MSISRRSTPNPYAARSGVQPAKPTVSVVLPPSSSPPAARAASPEQQRLATTRQASSRSLTSMATTTLQSLLADADVLESFRDYLETSFQSENLDFLLDVASLRTLQPAGDQARTLAQHIWNRYLSPSASESVNLPEHLIEPVAASLQQQQQRPLAGVFEPCLDHIWRLLEAECVPRYAKQRLALQFSSALSSPRSRADRRSLLLWSAAKRQATHGVDAQGVPVAPYTPIDWRADQPEPDLSALIDNLQQPSSSSMFSSSPPKSPSSPSSSSSSAAASSSSDQHLPTGLPFAAEMAAPLPGAKSRSRTPRSGKLVKKNSQERVSAPHIRLHHATVFCDEEVWGSCSTAQTATLPKYLEGVERALATLSTLANSFEDTAAAMLSACLDEELELTADVDATRQQLNLLRGVAAPLLTEMLVRSFLLRRAQSSSSLSSSSSSSSAVVVSRAAVLQQPVAELVQQHLPVTDEEATLLRAAVHSQYCPSSAELPRGIAPKSRDGSRIAAATPPADTRSSLNLRGDVPSQPRGEAMGIGIAPKHSQQTAARQLPRSNASAPEAHLRHAIASVADQQQRDVLSAFLQASSAS